MRKIKEVIGDIDKINEEIHQNQLAINKKIQKRDELFNELKQINNGDCKKVVIG